MSDIAIRVDNLSKLYPELSARACHLGALHQPPDTPSAALRTGLRDALSGFLPRISRTLAPARSAGESTLLKILSRITEPTSGRAKTCDPAAPCRNGRCIVSAEAPIVVNLWMYLQLASWQIYENEH